MWQAAMSTNFLTFLLWLGSIVINIIGWAIVAWRTDNKGVLKDIDDRLTRLERTRNKLIGWVQGSFGVDLNGD
jgi:hypothetical protein